MKWGTLLKDIREKVGLSQSLSTASSSSSASSTPAAASSARVDNQYGGGAAATSTLHDFNSSPSRDRHDLELDFKRFWEEFRSSSSEKEKEMALNLTVDVFCKLVKQHSNVAQLVTIGSDDYTVILWDLSSLAFVRQLPEFPAPISAIYVNDLTSEIVTAAGILLAVWSINGDCLAVVNTSQLPSDFILSVTSCTFSDWLHTNWYVTGHQSGAVKIWQMIHCSEEETTLVKSSSSVTVGLGLDNRVPEYKLILNQSTESSQTSSHRSSSSRRPKTTVKR